MKKINKWLYGWKLYVNYGQGWEYETFEDTREGYNTNRKAYRENCNYPQRWSRGKELNPEYSSGLKVLTAERIKVAAGVYAGCNKTVLRNDKGDIVATFPPEQTQPKRSAATIILNCFTYILNWK